MNNDIIMYDSMSKVCYYCGEHNTIIYKLKRKKINCDKIRYFCCKNCLVNYLIKYYS
jgi:hypothetical protein